eukprot:6614992-Ditylum_brightwellii.AAC.1
MERLLYQRPLIVLAIALSCCPIARALTTGWKLQTQTQCDYYQHRNRMGPPLFSLKRHRNILTPSDESSAVSLNLAAADDGDAPYKC